MKVFISYAREDEAYALKIFDDLDKVGIEPWIDQKKLLPGHNWQYQVKSNIETSDFFIALISSHSISKKGYVQSELKAALEILENYPHDEGFIIPFKNATHCKMKS